MPAAVAATLHNCTPEELGGNTYFRDLQCGQFVVPENPNKPSGKKISLNVVKAPALSANPAKDPVLILAGGPGQAATELEFALYPMLAEINRKRDIVMIDQRGTGKSNPLKCELDDHDVLGLSEADIIEWQATAIQQCFEGYEADIEYYLTPYAVDDFHYVMRQLGYSEVNLWGSSYGTRAALIFMRRHPDFIRSAVLDAVAPLELVLTQNMAVDAEAALRALLENCRRQASCQQQFGGLENKLSILIERLDREPRVIELVHPLSQEKLEVHVTGKLLSQYIRLALYSREVSSVLLLVIDSLTQGDYQPLASLIALGAESDQVISAGLHYTILCATDVNANVPSPQIETISQGSSTLLSLDPRQSYKRICDKLPKVDLPKNYFRQTVYKQPMLLVSGQFDPVTPSRWGEKALTTIEHAQHLVVPGAHHGASILGCMPKLISQFFNVPRTRLVDTSCIDKIRPTPPFITPAGPAMAASEVLND
ncbi:alpha/beta fold hydrolase [Aurantivibrio plasticivorans]